MASETSRKSVNFDEKNMEQAIDASIPVEAPVETPVDVPEVAEVAQTACSHHIPVRNFTFLTLAPITSASYPKHQRTSSTASTVSTAESVPAIDQAEGFIPADLASPTVGSADTTAEEIEHMLKTRRSSSVSSAEAFGRMRFLKLGPVHWGGEPGVPDFTLLE